MAYPYFAAAQRLGRYLFTYSLSDSNFGLVELIISSLPSRRSTIGIVLIPCVNRWAMACRIGCGYCRWQVLSRMTGFHELDNKPWTVLGYNIFSAFRVDGWISILPYAFIQVPLFTITIWHASLVSRFQALVTQLPRVMPQFRANYPDLRALLAVARTVSLMWHPKA